MSPQQYFKSHGGWATVSSHSVTCHLPDKAIIDIPIDAKSNLPMIWNVSTTSKEQRDIGPHLIGMANTLSDFEVDERSNSNADHFCSQAIMFDTICTKQASTFNGCIPCLTDKTSNTLLLKRL